MEYRVQVGGSKPIVVDQNGHPVANAPAHRVRFPEHKISGPDGDTYELSGPGTAEATIGGKRVSDIPLC